ncbi:hypothetical protein [Haloferula sp. BvORR071]|uniref:hypothetical protein n=1 Tax=Haloferula sp. BvORR071 TaxID=1396141 RepID=UPI002240F91E|nr:hypothetical protein [Haloferula sp. BvORR071]
MKKRTIQNMTDYQRGYRAGKKAAAAAEIEKRRAYYIANRDAIRENQRKYYESNRESILTKLKEKRSA